jgi:hypothetical protein
MTLLPVEVLPAWVPVEFPPEVPALLRDCQAEFPAEHYQVVPQEENPAGSPAHRYSWLRQAPSVGIANPLFVPSILPIDIDPCSAFPADCRN